MQCIRGKRRGSVDNPPPSLSSSPSVESLPTEIYLNRQHSSFLRRSFQAIRSNFGLRSINGRRNYSKSWTYTADQNQISGDNNADISKFSSTDDRNNNFNGSRLGFDDIGYFTLKKKKVSNGKTPKANNTYDEKCGFSADSSGADIISSIKKKTKTLNWRRERQRRPR